jgi:hypothetical protein
LGFTDKKVCSTSFGPFFSWNKWAISVWQGDDFRRWDERTNDCVVARKNQTWSGQCSYLINGVYDRVYIYIYI